MTDKERIERLVSKLEIYKLERECLLRVIRELWDALLKHEPDLSEHRPVDGL